jgi:hypothetical protein
MSKSFEQGAKKSARSKPPHTPSHTPSIVPPGHASEHEAAQHARAEMRNSTELARVTQTAPSGTSGHVTASPGHISTPPMVEAPKLDRGGMLLSPALREHFEPRFGYSLDGVRVHADAPEAEALNARAFTVGNQIAFGAGEYSPYTATGRALLAHELTHVVQQSESGQVTIQRDMRITSEPLPAITSGDVITGSQQGVRLIVSPGRGSAEFQYYGQPWVLLQWTTGQPSPAIDYNAIDRTNTLIITVRASYNIRASIDRRIDQRAANDVSNQRPTRIEYHLEFPGQVVIHNPDDTETTETTPCVLTYRYTPQHPSGEGDGGILSGEAPPPEIAPPETETPPTPRPFVPRLWSFDSRERLDEFMRSHADTNWVGIRTEDGQYVAFAMTVEALTRMAERVRRERRDFEVHNYVPGEVTSIFLHGESITMDAFANMYYRDDREAMTGRASDPQECEVYLHGTRYGRISYTHEQAVARWEQLDGMTYDQIRALESQPGHSFVALRVRGIRQLNTIDWEHYQARDVFMSRLDEFGSDNRDAQTEQFMLNYYVTHVERMGALVRRYLMVETDRPNPNAQFRAALEHGRLAWHVAEEVVLEVENIGQRFAFETMRTARDRLVELATSWEKMQNVVLMFPTMSSQQQTEAMELFGIPETARADTLSTLTNRSKAMRIAMGLTESGISISSLQQGLQTQADNLNQPIEQLRSWAVKALYLEGAFGVAVRNYAYARMGFRHITGASFPHTSETPGIFPGPLSGNTADFTNLGEQMYANVMAHQRHAEVLIGVLVATAVIAGTVLLLFVAGAAGAAVAGIIVGETTTAAGAVAFVFVETVASGVIFTGLQAGAMFAITGTAPTDPDHPDRTPLEVLAREAMTNVAMFGAFRLLNMGAAAGSLRTVRAFFGTEAALRASRTGMAAVNVLRVGAIGSAFMGMSAVQYYRQHGQFPRGHDLAMMVYENALTLAMLEIGGHMLRPAFESLGAWSRGRSLGYGERIDTNFRLLRQFVGNLADAVVRNEQGTTAQLTELRERLNAQKTLLEEIRASARTELDAIAQADIAEAIRQTQEAIDLLREIEFLHSARLRPESSGGGNIMFYRVGSEAEIRAYYGEGNVTGPDSNGEMRVRQNGRELILRPEPPEVATPRAPDPSVAGVLGRFVYRLIGSNNQPALQTLIAGLARAATRYMHGSTFRAGATPGTYELEITGTVGSGTSAGTPTSVVDIVIDYQPRGWSGWSAAGAAHGGEGGPATHATPELVNGRWRVRVTLHEELHQGDAPHLFEHEMNEIADFFRNNPTVDADSVAAAHAASTAPSVFRRGGTTSAASVTGHDRAAATEIMRLYEEWLRAREVPDPNAPQSRLAIEDRQARLFRMIDAMGLSREEPGAWERSEVLRSLLRERGFDENLIDGLVGDIDFNRARSVEGTNFSRTVTIDDLQGSQQTMDRPEAGHWQNHINEGVRTGHLPNTAAGERVILDILNNPQRVFSGVNRNGRLVDIYWQQGTVVVTERWMKTRVITAYGERVEGASNSVPASNWEVPTRDPVRGGPYNEQPVYWGRYSTVPRGTPIRR